MRSANQKHLSFKGIVIIFHQDWFLIISKKVVTIPLLDHLTVEIEKRFDHSSISVYSGLVIMPSKMVLLVYENVN